MISNKKLAQFINSRRYRPMDLESIANALGVEDAERGALQNKLDEMQRQGEIVLLSDNLYHDPGREGLIVGRLDCHHSGFGFIVTPEAGRKDLYVAGDDMNSAMHGDTVVARLKRPKRRGRRRRYTPGRRTGPSAKVFKVIERANRKLVGRYHPTRSEHDRLVPDDSRIFQTIMLDVPEDKPQPQKGDKVVAEIVEWPTSYEGARAVLLDVLGPEGSPRVDFYQVLIEFGIAHEFPQRVLDAAEAVPERIPEDALRCRRDCREPLTVTIDPENAKDFDDALSFYVDCKTGHRIVLVSIADVSYFVRPDGPLDAEARERGLSIYLANTVVPMLPHRLSSTLCSLIEGEDRLAKTVRLEFDERGRVVDFSIISAVINVDQRLNFNEVNAMIEGAERDEAEAGAIAALRVEPKVLEMVLALDELAQTLKDLRQEKGSIDLEIPDFDVMMDAEGRVLAVNRIVRDRSHSLVEEFMLAANKAVAQFMKSNKIPAVYRVHEEPGDEATELFRDFVKTVLGREIDPRDRRQLQELVYDVANTPVAEAVNLQLLRSFRRAQYSTRAIPHYALHFDLYCHFTSPVRRYPDLVVHQLLDEYFAGKLAGNRHVNDWKRKLEEIAQHATEMEYRAVEAEREYTKISLLRFLSDRIGEIFSAIVTGLADYGFFVQIQDMAVEGLVKLHTVTDDYYRLDEKQHALVGTRKGRMFRLGDRVRVKLEDIDVRRRQADFSLVKK